jgi:hypothetical protein
MDGILFPNGVPEGRESLQSYRARGGYEALAKAVKGTPEDIIKIITDSGLRGHGGAGFPAGKKWQFTREAPEQPRYLVMNGGEDEPGSRKDRILLENLPHLVIEGAILGAFAIGAAKAYLYINAKYEVAIQTIKDALAEAKSAGYWAEKILGSNYSLDIEIVAAGAPELLARLRAALRIDLNDSWTLTPTVMAQKTTTNGSFGFDKTLGDLKVAHALPENSDDKFTQAALTLQGKIGNWDLTYAGAYLKRDDQTRSDYADYSFFYDTCCSYGSYMYDNDGNLIDPSQFIQGSDHYTKQSHELRVSSPSENRWRLTAGAFYEDQGHGIRQAYKVANLADTLEVPGNSDTLWLTDQQRRAAQKIAP